MAEHNNIAADSSHPNKRKKKSFMSTAKQHGKQGVYGRGVELKEDEYNYFMTLSENMKNVQGEEMDMLLQTFFNEFTEENGMRFVCNQIISHMLDRMLPRASVSSVQHIIAILGKDLWAVCTDPFASHVLQSVLVISLRFIQEGSKVQQYNDDGNACEVLVTDEQKQSLREFIVKMGKYCNNNLHDFISETYASHVVRSLLEVMSGVQIPVTSKGGKQYHATHSLTTEDGNSSDKQIIKVPQDLQELLAIVAKRLQQVADLPSVITSDCGSAVYQAALQVLKPNHYTDLCHPLLSHVLTHGLSQLEDQQYNDEDDGGYGGEGAASSSESQVHPAFQCNATARLLEVVIDCSDGTEEELGSIYRSYFEGKLEALVGHRAANFAVQRLLGAWSDKGTFEGLSTAMSAAVPAALSAQHNGVVLAWAKACGRLKVQQGTCCLALLDALNCSEESEADEEGGGGSSSEADCAPCLIYLMPRQQYRPARLASRDTPLKVTLHGALLLQEILGFKKPIKFVKSLVSLSVAELVQLFCDPRGCHITDAYCSSAHVGEKNRFKMVTRIQDEAVTLACSKHGSRSLEALWAVAAPPSRVAMCQRLSDSAARLKGSPYGAILYSKFNVRLFSRANKEDWAQLEQRKANKRKKIQALLQGANVDLTEFQPASKKKKMEVKSDED